MHISSPSNPRIKNVVRLQQQPRHRRDAGLFCVESARELARALDAGFDAAELYVCDDLCDDRDVIERAVGEGDSGRATLDTVTEPVLAKLAYRENPEGFVAVLRWRRTSLDAVPRSADEWFVVCSGIEKPGNVGAILRSADAAGAAAVLVDNPEADVFNPNTIRASTGAVFTTPAVCDDADSLIAALSRRGVRMVAVTPESGHRYTDADLTGPIALVMGAEAEGLADVWRNACGASVSIPMRGRVDSINVSVAAAVVMFEAVRQREML